MAWPNDTLTNAHLDSDTDSPLLARQELDATVLLLKAILAEIAAGSTVWHSGNDGAASGLDADLLDGSEKSSILARANHTGTQLLSTISDAGALAALNSINNTRWSGEDLSIANGGTGASTASGARANLGIGTAATTIAVTSSKTTLVAAGSAMTWNHGKGKLPFALTFYATCISADGSYSVGNVVILSVSNNSENDSGSGPSTNGLTMHTTSETSNDINLIHSSRGYYIDRKDTALQQIMTAGKWDIWFKGIW